MTDKLSQLRDLIEEIEALPEGAETRELSDRVLLATGKTLAPEGKRPTIKELEAILDDPDPGTPMINPDGSVFVERPDPLANLQDATLVVPEGWDWRIASTGGCRLWRPATAPVQIEDCKHSPARALTLASLKARLAQMEADDG